MSVFDPKSFAQMTFVDANSTEFIPIPAAEWPFTITKSEIVAWQKKDDPTQGGLKCVLTMETEDATVAQVTGRPKSILKHEMMLDLTPEGGLDMGKGMNVNLGRAREACGLNKPGAPFGFDMFIGHNVKAMVGHETYQDKLQARCKGIVNANSSTPGAAPSGYVPGA